MFDDLDLDDEFSEDGTAKNKNGAADLDFAQESESGEFDANELLNLTDYKNKRAEPAAAVASTKQSPFTKP